MLELTRHAHARPVNWRWQRATMIVDQGRKIHRKHDDPILVEAVDLQRELKKRRTDEQKLWLADNYPHMFDAWSLRFREPSELFKAEVEARLLSRESLANIAKKTGVSVLALAYYEAWFFNVLDRIDQPSYIFHQVIGESVRGGLSEREFDTLWKLYGYQGGPYVLDAMIYCWDNPTRPDDPNKVGSFLADSFRSQLRAKAEMVLRTMPLARLAESIMDGWMRWQEMERASGGSGGSGTQEAILANMKSFLEQLPWEFDEDKVDDNPTIAAFDVAGVGLRASELMLIGTNQAPADLINILGQFKRPMGE